MRSRVQDEGVVDPPPIDMHAAVASAETSRTFILAECIQTAQQRQPRIAVELASLAAAEEAERALGSLHIPASLDSQVPIRRRQSNLGVSAAAAGVEQMQRDTAYAVIRTYMTVLFAREQERVARSVVERLTATREAAQRALDAGDREVNSTDIQRTSVYLRMSEARLLQASQGVKRALAALREATGFGPEVLIDIPGSILPDVAVRVDRNEVLNAALARRGEMLQARILAQVVCLEVDAQRDKSLATHADFCRRVRHSRRCGSARIQRRRLPAWRGASTDAGTLGGFTVGASQTGRDAQDSRPIAAVESTSATRSAWKLTMRTCAGKKRLDRPAK